MLIRRLARRIRYWWGTHIQHRSEMEIDIAGWRKAGVTIGDDCMIYSQLPTRRDCFLLEIGNRVTVSGGVSFLLHDNSVIKVTDGEYTDTLGRIVIGDDCFIGANVTVLPGVTLANRVIVGAGSVVTKSFSQSDIIVAGNPAKIVCTCEEYRAKNELHFLSLNGLSMDDIRTLVNERPEVLVKC